jgi:hypothetical protein
VVERTEPSGLPDHGEKTLRGATERETGNQMKHTAARHGPIVAHATHLGYFFALL